MTTRDPTGRTKSAENLTLEAQPFIWRCLLLPPEGGGREGGRLAVLRNNWLRLPMNWQGSPSLTLPLRGRGPVAGKNLIKIQRLALSYPSRNTF